MEENKKNEVVWKILQCALLKRKVEFPEDIDWDEVYHEIVSHKITSLCGPWLATAPLPKELKGRWTQNLFQSVLRWKVVMNEQHKLIELLHSQDISLVIMKGAAAGRYFPVPEQRTTGDIDFMVLPEQFNAAAKTMEDNGYQLMEQARHHWEYEKNSVSCELHRFPSGMNKDDEHLMKLLEDGIHNAEVIECRGYMVPQFPTTQNGLVFLWHIIHHMQNGYRGLGLRQFCDWLMYAENALNDEFYHKEFEPVLKVAGLENLAVCVTRMCQMYLGLTEDITWCKMADDRDCEFLMNEVMKAGNFGRKFSEQQKQESATEKMDESMNLRIQYYLKHPVRYFSSVQQKGMREWKALDKHPYLTPFAWIYKIVSSLAKAVHVLKKGNASVEMKKANDRMLFYTKMGMVDIGTTADNERE